MDATKDAIDHGYISGISPTNHQWSALAWSFPAAGQPYSKIKSLPVTVQVSPTDTNYYVFYLGKSITTKKWEVFSASKLQGDRWEPVAVKLPEPESGK